MAIRSITQLKKWFRRGMYPTESQFADWIDSFWHKEEDRIPMSTIEGLPEVINNKYPADAGKELEREVDTLTADLAAHKVESEYKFNCINEDIADLETIDEEIKADLVTVHQDITDLQATDTAIRADIETLQQTDTKIKQDITDLQAADAQLTQQISTKADTGHTHTAGQIQEDANHRFVTDAEKTAWNEKIPSVHTHTIANVTNLQNTLDEKLDKTGGKLTGTLEIYKQADELIAFDITNPQYDSSFGKSSSMIFRSLISPRFGKIRAVMENSGEFNRFEFTKGNTDGVTNSEKVIATIVDGSMKIGDKTAWHSGNLDPNNIKANGGNADTVGGLSADNIARGGYLQYVITGNGWFRIAKIKNDTGSAIFTILNYWNNNRPSSVTFIISTEYKGLPEHGAAITQIGGNSYIIQKARIIGSTNSNECYLDIYINQNTAGNPWIITCSNAINFSLIEPIASVVPDGYTINLEQTFKANYTNLTAKAAESIAGQLIIANQNNTDGHGGAIHLREYDRQSDDSNFYNAPAITFHWAGKYVKRLGMHGNGHLYFGENDDRLAYARELPSVSVQSSAPTSNIKDGDIWIKP